MKISKTTSAAPGKQGSTMIADIRHEYAHLISKSWRRLSGGRAATSIFKRRRKNRERAYKKISRRSIRFLRHKLKTLEDQDRSQSPSS